MIGRGAREVVGRKKNGESLELQLLLNEVKDPHTGGRNYIAILNDVTKMKHLIKMNEVSLRLEGGYDLYSSQAEQSSLTRFLSFLSFRLSLTAQLRPWSWLM